MSEVQSNFDKKKKLMVRPPVVTIMGHVDHGKTTLLDYIRKAKVAEGEHGGITQHIGAYQIKDPEITFIDTPGHAAFKAMRARGGMVADLVVLVIAANEGMKPQTEESLQHIREAGIPFIVAINKVDLEVADVDMVKRQLAEVGYLPESEGGKLITVPVSAMNGKGVDQLLEMIGLVAEMQELKVDESAELKAVVIESELDKRKGPIASLIVRQGMLKVGDKIYTETVEGKVKALFDHVGNSILSAGPSQPVQVLGFAKVPDVGSQVHVGLKSDLPVVSKSVLPVRNLGTVMEKKQLAVIVKTDVAGSGEAINHSLPEGVVIIDEGVGQIAETDVLLARTTGARVIGFNVDLPKSVAKLAEVENVEVKTFKVIYELFEYLSDQYQRLIDPLYGLDIKAKAEVLAEFKINKDRVAGSKVTFGELLKEHNVRVMREGEIVKNAKIKSLRQGKDEVNKVNQGGEFGIVFSPHVDFHVGDLIIAY